jgi:protease I
VKTAVFVIAEKIFRDEEYDVPKKILINADIKVITASTTTNEAIGKLGMKVKPNILVEEINIDELDALIFIGGGGASQYFDDSLAHKLARETLEKNKILGAICIAPVILANAGVLKNIRATVFPDGKKALEKGGAQYTGAPVEIDGNIITASGPQAAETFGNEIVKLLA